jgi:hypothetical protein
LVGKLEGREQLGVPLGKWEYNIKVDLREVECELEGFNSEDLSQCCRKLFYSRLLLASKSTKHRCYMDYLWVWSVCRMLTGEKRSTVRKKN